MRVPGSPGVAVPVCAPSGRTPWAGEAPDPSGFAPGPATIGALAALAAGDALPAGDLLRFLARGDPTGPGQDDSEPAEVGVSAERLALLGALAARHLRTTGDRRLAAEARRVLRPYASALGGAAGGAPRTGPPTGSQAEALARLASPAPPSSTALAAVRAWDAFVRGDPAEGWRAWREAETGAADWWDLGLLVLVFTESALGIEPDAERGRLVLRPRLPSGIHRLDVRGIRVGEASAGLRYRREAGLHAFTLVPLGGAVPLRVVLEPALAGPVIAVTVDGRSASLELGRLGALALAPLQLVLDDHRTVRIRVDD